MKKVMSIVLSYVVFSLIASFVYAAFFEVKPTLFEADIGKFIFLQGLMVFFKFFPAIVSSGFLIGGAISFSGSLKEDSLKIFSHLILNSVVLVFLLFIVSEVLVPICTKKQDELIESPIVFDEFMSLSRKCYSEGKMSEAARYANEAFIVNPNSVDAASIRELAVASEDSVSEKKVLPKKNPKSYLSETGNFSYHDMQKETVDSLLKKSFDSEKQNNWIDSHYYAQLALGIAQEGSVDFYTAQKRSEMAWKKLLDSNLFSDSPEVILFKEKLRCYTLLNSGDFSEAYYGFLALSNSSFEASRDPDVIKYLKIATEKVKLKYFFIDELENLRRFEANKNVHFSTNNPDGSVDVVYIKGITKVKEGGKIIRFLRGLSIFTYTRDGTFDHSISVPYAKLVPEPMSFFDIETRKKLGIDETEGEIPYIMLDGIDSQNKNRYSEPEYSVVVGSSYIPNPDEAFTVFDILMEDFELICDSSIGADKMSMISLWRIFGKAKEFGFSRENFGATLVRRVTYPITLLILFVFLACIAWSYRIEESQIFKFKWIFILPFVSLVLYFFLELLKYVLKILNYVFIVFFDYAAIGISAAFMIFVLLIVSILFVAKKQNEFSK